jgi:hypothetical protein
VEFSPFFHFTPLINKDLILEQFSSWGRLATESRKNAIPNKEEEKLGQQPAI